MKSIVDKKIEYQNILFKDPKRSSLLALMNNFKSTKKIFIHRNEAVENIFSLANKFFEQSGDSLEFIYGDYDESLLFTGRVESDLDIVIFNLDRVDLFGVELNKWFLSRIEKLKLLSKRILITYYSDSQKASDLDSFVKGVVPHTYNLQNLLLQGDLFDKAREKVTGSILSSRVHVPLAKEIGGRLISDSLDTHVKAIVFDLDNTLYGGIVGEDGVELVDIKSRKELHNLIIELKNNGILLGLCSKNDIQIIEQLFDARKEEFGFDLNIFTSLSIDWNSKSSGIKKIASQMRISEADIIFVDDNYSELVEVTSNTRLSKIVYATNDAGVLAETLKYFPGVWRSKVRAEDLLRHDDLIASMERDTISHLSEEDYFKQLEMKVTFNIGDSDIQRCVELSNKTNQYNLSFQRFSASIIEDYLSSPTKKVVTISLEDKMTNSGKIGLLLFDVNEDELILNELCISCRALGRKLEDLFLFEVLKNVFPKITKLTFDYKYGERNQPLYNWLSKFIQLSRLEDKRVTISIEALMRSYSTPKVKVLFEGKNYGN